MNRGASGTYDPEEEARIAEWNSAYNRDDANAKKSGNANVGIAQSSTDADAGTTADGKKKTVVREAGGKHWEDETLCIHDCSLVTWLAKSQMIPS
jgi:hypothetical protein